VSLLAKAYAAFVGITPAPGKVRRLNPSGYPESQGTFAERVRGEAAVRPGLPCCLGQGEQSDFPEPPVRVNHRFARYGAVDVERERRVGRIRGILPRLGTGVNECHALESVGNRRFETAHW